MIIVYPDLKFVPETNVDEKIRQSITDFTLLMNKYYGSDRDICKDIYKVLGNCTVKNRCFINKHWDSTRVAELFN